MRVDHKCEPSKNDDPERTREKDFLWRMLVVRHCFCGKPARSSTTGRPATYCSAACKQAAYRQRRADVTKRSVTKQEDILFYCGLNEHTWSHHPLRPGPRACIAPVYGRTIETKRVNCVTVPDEVEEVLLDSGAFSDKLDERLSFEEAKHRQIAHAYRFQYSKRVCYLASYDLLIDEKWSQDGERSKKRWQPVEAEFAVQETVAAARYLARERRALHGVFGRRIGLALSAQGVEVEQYLRCARQIVPLMEDGDIFGLGGWCITGLQPDLMLPSFRAILREVIPYLGSQGVKHAHLWGVCHPEALGEFLSLCVQADIQPSTDSSGPCRYPTLGQWGYGTWRNPSYKAPPILPSCKVVDGHGNKVPTCPPGTSCRGLERARHVQLTRDWLAHFREREPDWYREPHLYDAASRLQQGCYQESAL